MNDGGSASQRKVMHLVDEEDTDTDGIEAIHDCNNGGETVPPEPIDGNSKSKISSTNQDAQGDQMKQVGEGEEGDDLAEMSEDDDDGEQLPSVPNKRRARGPTRRLKLVGVKGNARPIVELNMFNQPIGPEPDVQHLAPAIGILAKTPNVVSLEYRSWKMVPPKVKDIVWEMINKTFIIPDEGKPWVLKSAGESWRTFKSHLKAKHFKETLTEDQMIKRRPKLTVPEDQWKALVKYWFDPKTMELSRRNRISVQHRKNVHTAGSRSFARIAASEAKLDGKDPSLAAVYIKTRTSKTGVRRVDDKTREELLNLGHDDAQVAEYLVANNLLKKRPGSVLLKGRGVT